MIYSSLKIQYIIPNKNQENISPEILPADKSQMILPDFIIPYSLPKNIFDSLNN